MLENSSLLSVWLVNATAAARLSTCYTRIRWTHVIARAKVADKRLRKDQY